MRFTPTSIVKKIDVSVDLSNVKLDPCNNIDVIQVPSGVNAWISFEESPSIEHIYPLYTNASCRLEDIDGFADAELIYLHTTGTNATTDLILNLSVIKRDSKSFIIDKNADEVGITEDVLLRFENAINPYSQPTHSSAFSTSNTEVILLTETLTCDKIELELNSGYLQDANHAYIYAKLDGNFLALIKKTCTATGGTTLSEQRSLTVENVKGKTLTIAGLNGSVKEFFYYLQKYTKKA